MKSFFVTILIVGLCHGASKADECTARGRYPNDDAENCQGYTTCLIGITNFTQYKLKCPAGSIYSHLEQQCTNSTNYHCLPIYNCTSLGNFVYPDGENNCASFVACPQGIGEIVTARLVQCSSNMVFNPNVSQCVNETEYLCPGPHFPDVVENNLIIKYNVTYNNAVNLSVKSMFLFSLAMLMML